MLGLEPEALGHLSQEHLREPHPVLAPGAGQERLRVGAAPVRAGQALVDALGGPLQQAHGDVAVQEGQPLQEEAPGRLDAPGSRKDNVVVVLKRFRYVEEKPPGHCVQK